MSPNPWFMLAMFIGLVVVATGLAVKECNPGVEILLNGLVVDKTVVVRRSEEPVRARVDGCPRCPGTQVVTTRIVREEKHYYLLVEAEEKDKLGTYRVEVTPRIYDELEVGTPVQIRIARAKNLGFLCSRPELVLPGDGGP